MFVLLAVVVLVVLLRIALDQRPIGEEERPQSRLFGTGLLAMCAACILGLPEIGERLMDPAAARLLGQNISDLLRGLYFLAALALLAIPGLQTAIRYYAQNSTADYERWWLTLCASAGVTMIITSRLGDARTTPVGDELELTDTLSGIYVAVFAAVAIMTCVIMALASAIVIRQRGWSASIALAGAVGVVGGGLATATLVLLIVDRPWLAAHHPAVATGWSIPLTAVLALAGILGAVRDRRRRCQR